MKTTTYILTACTLSLTVLCNACDNIPDELTEVTVMPGPKPEPEPGELPQNAVDLGLSVAWGTNNLGTSNANPAGTYFCFGALSGDETSCTISASITNICNSKFDAARQTLGLGWRLPTQNELYELKNNCTWKVVTQNEVTGFQVTGKNGNSIFLPLSGYFYRFSSSKQDSDYAYIASGERSSSSWGSYVLSIHEEYDYSITHTVERASASYYRYPIRPVYDASLVTTD